MTVRIISEAELREALREQNWLRTEREHALNELGALREWFGYSPSKQKEWGDPDYPLELIGEIERAVQSWPEPITAADLKE